MISIRQTTRGRGGESGEVAVRSDRVRPWPGTLQRSPLERASVEGVCIRRAISPEEIADVRRFVEDRRTRLGEMARRSEGPWADAYEAIGRTARFAALSWPDVVGSASVVTVADNARLPADVTFCLELGVLRKQGRFVCEMTDRAVAPEYHPTNMPNDLLRCCVAQAHFIECTDLVTVIGTWQHDKHVALGFNRISQIQNLSSEMPHPVVLMRLDLENLRDATSSGADAIERNRTFLSNFYLRDNPYHRYVRKWADLADTAMGVAV